MKSENLSKEKFGKLILKNLGEPFWVLVDIPFSQTKSVGLPLHRKDREKKFSKKKKKILKKKNLKKFKKLFFYCKAFVKSFLAANVLKKCFFKKESFSNKFFEKVFNTVKLLKNNSRKKQNLKKFKKIFFLL
jgi:hypothetical protein